MNSGSPEPANELSFILNMKREQTSNVIEVVSEASRWIKAQLSGAGVEFAYTPCEADNPSTFATFSVSKEQGNNLIVLDLKVAEINSKPYVFAQVLQVGAIQGQLFPYFADISSSAAKQSLMHYIADFILL
ncbi:hypothetical protein [Coraliomargarita akajimensis]|uniref:Uncharacterized protein n=1 Tax=Coraliomargarita akajimensis (strain DSM 45221 / IAM 15411 / JCM 23193 / KCTC 12865 / 04OKA010-24) TaxID=583355 RepID=D5EPA3_CORAD|nr:hypothetical protein [Coraliomargarita akajimensis]ADE55613.1 hypothetical protein Caka_2597 [Coraliomargarita akajimensis DSM 45221]